MAAGENFVRTNGPLRVLILMVGATDLGLILASFNGSNPAEVYQLTVVAVFFAATAISVVGWLIGGAGSAMCKIIDYTVHAYGCWLLINSAMAKSLVINSGRRTNSQGEMAIRILSVVFGFINAGLYSWLAHVTAGNKSGLPCIRTSPSAVSDAEAATTTMESNEGNKQLQTTKQDQRKAADSKRAPVEKKPLGDPLFTPSPKSPQKPTPRWNFKQHCSRDSIKERLMWTTIFDGGLMQMRIFTFVLGLLNVIFISKSYGTNDLYDEYFLGVVCFSFGITAILHFLYVFGVSECVTRSWKIFDYSFHCSHGVCLITGATLALAITINWAVRSVMFSIGSPQWIQTARALAFENAVADRTIASVLGICNGILYVLIGLKQRDVSAEQEVVEMMVTKERQKNANAARELKDRNEDDLDSDLAVAVSALNSRNSQVTKEYKDKNIPMHRQGGRTTNIFDPNKF